ncbi:hypothetical protein AB9P05_12130 [Roseivirga sp. BDSF3-8]|uniref:hypothetical protein n=1 Tax=Roseivirga sp. BDSF3-8 TaxID=3241598 RepID=UPI003531E671
MKNFKFIFLAIYFLYHLALVILVLTIDNSFQFVMNNMVPGALLGMLLFLINLGMVITLVSRYKKRLGKLEKEILEVKSRVYDREKKEEEIDRDLEAFGRTMSAEEKKKKQLGSGDSTAGEEKA